MRALELAYERIAHQGSELPDSLIPLRQDLRATAERVFERWARFDPENALDEERVSLQQLTREYELQLDQLESTVSDQVLRDLYTDAGRCAWIVYGDGQHTSCDQPDQLATVVTNPVLTGSATILRVLCSTEACEWEPHGATQ